MAWLDGLSGDALNGVQYTVFGTGNRDWARTYQAIPKKIDQRFAELNSDPKFVEKLIREGY